MRTLKGIFSTQSAYQIVLFSLLSNIGKLLISMNSVGCRGLAPLGHRTIYSYCFHRIKLRFGREQPSRCTNPPFQIVDSK